MNLADIWEQKQPEGQRLEYKSYEFDDGKFNSIKEKERNKFAQVISSMANAEGGTIIIGIREDEDKNPSKIVDVGVNSNDFETWQQSFRQYMSSRIKPVIYGIDCTLKELEGQNLIQIDIPNSVNKPHAFNNGSKDELFIRYGNMTNPMLLDDLRDAFENKSMIENKIINFKNERLSMILGNEIIGDLEGQAGLALHIIPESSMRLNSYIDVKEARLNQNIDIFSPASRHIYRAGKENFNMDGLLIQYKSFGKTKASATQLFHNGGLEAFELRLMNMLNEANQKNYIFDWEKLEKILAERIYTYSVALEELNIPRPYYIFVTLFNVKGMQSKGSFELYPEEPISRNIVKLAPGFLIDGKFEDEIAPILNSLANTFGIEKSAMYLNDGEADSSKFDFLK